MRFRNPAFLVDQKTQLLRNSVGEPPRDCHCYTSYLVATMPLKMGSGDSNSVPQAYPRLTVKLLNRLSRLPRSYTSDHVIGIQKRFFFSYFICMCFLSHVRLCTMCIPGICRAQKKVSSLLELDLQIVIHCRVGARN